MSLDLLKERFSGKPITSQYEDKIQNKEKIIEKLESEAQNLSNKILNLEKEKNFLVQELNKSQQFEDGAFSIKEKNYVNELQSKDVVIKEGKQKTNSLYEQLDKKDERLVYKNKIIDNSLKITKEAKNKINYLNVKLQNSKNSKKELKLEIKKTYKKYLFEINNFENQIKNKNELISGQKQVLKKDNKKLQDLSNKLQELKVKNINSKKVISELDNKLQQSENSLVVKNNKFQKEINSKENTISELQSEMDILSNQVIALTETAQDKTILEKKLQEAEQFQNIVKNNKNNYQVVAQKKSKILNTDNLIFKLKEISKQKQGLKPLNWQQWIEIPESNYLNELNHSIALKLFNENNNLYLQDERRKHDKHSRMEMEAPTFALLPLTVSGLQGYYSSQVLSNTFSDGDDVTNWNDLSSNKNHLIQSGDDDLAEYNAAEDSLLFKRKDEANTNDNYLFTNTIEASEFTTFFVVSMTADSGVHSHNFLLDTEDNDQILVQFAADNRAFLKVLANDGTNSVASQINKDAGIINEGTKLLLTCRKKPHNSDDGFGQVEWFLNKTSLGTEDDYDENIVHSIQRLGDDSTFTGFKGHMYEMGIYDRALSDTEISELQDYFINRTSISV
tara:strand:+ start:54 stop:1910 length:1857 start_codon:yes stop_codon:yes gene_type:complete